MSNVAMRSAGTPQVTARTKAIDKYLAVPLAACIFALIVNPLLLLSCSPTDVVCIQAPRLETRIIWPLLAAISVFLAVRNRHRIWFPPHIICLFVYLAFAGASVIWAFRPELSFIRYTQQVMIISTVILPALIMAGRADLMRGLFVCFALASMLNVFFVLGPPPKLLEHATPGYSGYFAGKNYLGQCAGITVLLSLYELRGPGLWRLLAIVAGAISVYLLILSNAKTALALAILAPVLAGCAIALRRMMRASMLTLPLAILAAYLLALVFINFSIYKISYLLYGESTFTGRKFIWDFALFEISQRPLLGWGYQSFWLVGADAPSIVDARGFVKLMPNAHNGYLDAILEMGYCGFILLVAFLSATLRASGRLVDRDPGRAWCVLALAFFVMISNGLETFWMRGFEFMWVVFLVICAEIGRHLQLYRPVVQLGATVVDRAPIPVRSRHAPGSGAVRGGSRRVVPSAPSIR